MTETAGRAPMKDRLLVIGDGMPTDIKGVAQNGFDAYFVAGGIHASDMSGIMAPQNFARAYQLITRQFSDLNLVGICDQLRWSGTISMKLRSHPQ